MAGRLGIGQSGMLARLSADVNLAGKAYLSIQAPMVGEVLEFQQVTLFTFLSDSYVEYNSQLLPDGTFANPTSYESGDYSDLETELKGIPFNATTLWLTDQTGISAAITAMGCTEV